MKRIGNLYPEFCSFANLLSAYRKARMGTRANQETGAFFLHQEAELLQLQDELREMTYYPRPYRYFQIRDPKVRTISVAAFRDRVVHHALVNMLEPIYERVFIFDSYATRKGKGNHLAILRAQHLLRHNPWFLKSDVDKYFDSIRQDTLLDIIARKIKDKGLLEITARILHNGGVHGCGLPIGNLTSQFFANVYLNTFDTYVKQELGVRHYIRYMDDFVLFEKDKARLKALLPALEAFLADHLHLRIKRTATFMNQASNGLTFLGKRIFPALIRIARPNLKRMQRRMKTREIAWQQGEITEDQFLASQNSCWACLAFGDTYKLRKCLSSS
jgi:RNA-directed DNA polymerase